MTHTFSRNSLLSVAVPFIAIVILSLAFIALAQMPGPGQPSPQRSVVSAQLAPDVEVPRARFAKEVTYYSGTNWAWSYSVAIGDLRGDGVLDLALANFGNNTVGVLLGNGDGTFQTAVTYGSGGGSPWSVAIADVNGDGKPDLVVANGASNNVGVLLGNGDGTFQPVVTFSSGGVGPLSVAIADVNGDGKPDLVIANSGSNNVGVLLGNGDGTFQPAVTYGSGSVGPDSVAVADLNGDGVLDIVVANQGASGSNGAASVLLGNGDGTFQPAITYGSGGYGATSVAIADVNGDGKPDLMVANSCADNPCTHGSVGVLLGNGDGTFQPVVTFSSGAYGANSVAVMDVNGDGKPDLAVANTCFFYHHQGPHSRPCESEAYRPSAVVSVLLGNGDGTFQPATIYTSGWNNAHSVAIADLNGDGKPDLIVNDVCPNWACINGGGVGVLMNETKPVLTKTNVTSSLNPSQVNQLVTFTATTTSTKPIPNGEVVAFYNGATEIGTASTVNGVASVTTSFSSAGKYIIRASYPGDPFLKASSGGVKQVVEK